MESRTSTASSEPKRPTRAPARDKPDPRPARLMLGAGALAALTVVGAGLVDFPTAVAEQPLSAPAKAAVTKIEKVKRPVKYVRLKPGQQAPRGARVIKEAAPAPRVVVQRIVVSSARQPSRTVARSRQSGG